VKEEVERKIRFDMSSEIARLMSDNAALRAEVEALKRTATEAGKAIGNLSQLNTELREVLEDARAAMAAHDYYYGEGCRARFTDEIAQATAALAQTQEVTE
jgi:hypothetical protein